MIIRMLKQSPAGSAHHSYIEIAEMWDDEFAILAVRDAVDMLSAPALSDAISATLTKAPLGLVVDLTEVDFLGSIGMSVLIEAQEQASALSMRFGVVADGAATSRPMKLLGIDAMLAIYPTLDEALSQMA